MKPPGTERRPGSPEGRSPRWRIVLAATVAAAVGMALGVVLGDFASPATARGGRLERLPIPAAAASAAAVAPELPVLAERQVRNVVLLVGDGMGLTQLAAGRILALGIDGRFHLERFPTIGLLTTHAAGAPVTIAA